MGPSPFGVPLFISDAKRRVLFSSCHNAIKWRYETTSQSKLFVATYYSVVQW
jgi:hypothetical protein